MSTIELIGGIVLLVVCTLIIFLCLAQDQKQDQNMTSAITGGSYDSHFSKNEGNTKEAILKKWTLWLSVIFVVTVLVVIIIPVHFS
ncbi:MAG: preprotein translocase subunit SecG [Oscillospiraceae bacterium]|nr:preprotein translocase subunit SecG [Oscillospiraceae bacterium]